MYAHVGERPLDDSKRLCAHLLEKAIDELDDECETILGIFDLRGFGTQNADFGFVKFLVRLCTTLTQSSLLVHSVLVMHQAARPPAAAATLETYSDVHC